MHKARDHPLRQKAHKLGIQKEIKRKNLHPIPSTHQKLPLQEEVLRKQNEHH
jgi:hypothetical protein